MIDPRLNEVYRDKGLIFDDSEEIKNTEISSFFNKKQSFNSQEPVAAATLRITAFMNEQLEKYAKRYIKIGIVSHETILSPYFGIIGKYYNQPAELYKH